MRVKLSLLSEQMRRRRRVDGWWRDECEAFLRDLARNGRRRKTLETYRTMLSDLGEWLMLHHIRALAEIRPEHVEEWQDGLPAWAGPSTLRVAATAARGLLKWAAKQNRASAELWLRVAHPRAPRLLPRPIPEADLVRILAALDPPTSAEPTTCARALFLVLLSSGARISEALQLERDSFRNRAATVIQKGGALHTMVISERAEAAVLNYLGRRTDACPAMFVNERGRALSPKKAQAAWDALCAELRIQRFTSHQARHSCATTMLANGIDWLVIARHLGHRSLQAIQGYTAVALKSRLEAVQALDRALAS